MLALFSCLAFLARPQNSLSGAEGVTAPEYPLKAAFLFNFAKVIEWPKTTFRDAKTPMVVGVFGKDPFGGDLELVFGKRQANGRNVVINRFNNVAEAKTCQILFVPATEQGRWSEISEAIKGLSVLTVGETAQFTQMGGIISLVPVGTTRMTINMDAAERANLVVGSLLQNIATIVRPSRPQ